MKRVFFNPGMRDAHRYFLFGETTIIAFILWWPFSDRGFTFCLFLGTFSLIYSLADIEFKQNSKERGEKNMSRVKKNLYKGLQATRCHQEFCTCLKIQTKRVKSKFKTAPKKKRKTQLEKKTDNFHNQNKNIHKF